MYRPSTAALRDQDGYEEPNLFEKLVTTLFLLGYFTLLPIVLMVLLNWAAYGIAATTFYQEFWMMPALLVLATFLGGALMRQRMEEEQGGMGLFFVGLIALALFAWLTLQDINDPGLMYSRFMPKMLRPSMADYVYAIPAIGMFGMLFYKYFTLKTYS